MTKNNEKFNVNALVSELSGFCNILADIFEHKTDQVEFLKEIKYYILNFLDNGNKMKYPCPSDITYCDNKIIKICRKIFKGASFRQYKTELWANDLKNKAYIFLNFFNKFLNFKKIKMVIKSPRPLEINYLNVLLIENSVFLNYPRLFNNLGELKFAIKKYNESVQACAKIPKLNVIGKIIKRKIIKKTYFDWLFFRLNFMMVDIALAFEKDLFINPDFYKKYNTDLGA